MVDDKKIFHPDIHPLYILLLQSPKSGQPFSQAALPQSQLTTIPVRGIRNSHQRHIITTAYYSELRWGPPIGLGKRRRSLKPYILNPRIIFPSYPKRLTVSSLLKCKARIAAKHRKCLVPAYDRTAGRPHNPQSQKPFPVPCHCRPDWVYQPYGLPTLRFQTPKKIKPHLLFISLPH